jgi:hypothetical protein
MTQIHPKSPTQRREEPLFLAKWRQPYRPLCIRLRQQLRLSLGLYLYSEPESVVVHRVPRDIVSLKVPVIVRRKVPADVYPTACSTASESASSTE